ncbi:hypothetical protein TNCV_2582981 [Trichonephila clavipes]|nr:hypothetical protein TNCV_2582981 [Trichonephila clavipes]
MADESSKEHSLEEEICETQYQNTHYLSEEGRYVVQLPVKKDPYCLGKGRIIIHGFADASTAAYCAVLYAQSISEEDVSTRLLCSKSRVASVKPINIPRLELCAIVTAPGK